MLVQKIEITMAVSCVVGAAQAWLPFSDPVVDETPLLECFQARISVEISRQTPPWNITSFERHPHQLLCLLRRCNYNMEQSMLDWCAWVSWRREQRIDEITDELIRCDQEANLIKWHGHDKKGRLCCVVTGRHMNPEGRRRNGGTGQSFQKFLIRSVEDGCRKGMENSITTTTGFANGSAASSSASSGPPTQNLIDRDHDPTTTSTSDAGANPVVNADAGPDFCIVYDRRGLDWQHIDPMLYKLSRNIIDDLRVRLHSHSHSPIAVI